MNLNNPLETVFRSPTMSCLTSVLLLLATSNVGLAIIQTIEASGD